MKRLLFAVAAIALAASGASADTGSCLSVSDMAGDATVTSVLPPAGLFQDLDLVSVTVSATTGAVSTTFSTVGRPQPAPGGFDKYVVSFEDADWMYELEADTWYGDLQYPGDNPFTLNVGRRVTGAGGAGVQEWSTTAVSGSIDLDAHTVTVTAPAAAFGSLAAGREWTVTGMRTYVGAMGVSTLLTDEAAVPHTLVVGDGC